MVDEALKTAEDKMHKAIESTREEFSGIRTGRASSTLLEKLTIDYYGSPTPLKQLASFSVPEPRQLLVSPFDRNTIASIEKAIMAANLGITPSNDGSAIRCSFPALTEETRKDMIKLVHDRAEHGRVSIRNIRRNIKEGIDKDIKDGKVGEDQGHRAEKELQKLTDRFIGEIDTMVKRKEQELTEV
ncbi:MAG: ribosome recycling factor [Actinomycetota bacterium]